MNIFNRMLLLLNMSMFIYIMFLTGQVSWVNDINIISTSDTSKVEHNMNISR